MKIVCLIAAVILLLMSLTCITLTVIEVVREQTAMGSTSFWIGVGFHAVTAAAGAALLSIARRKPDAGPAEKEDAS